MSRNKIAINKELVTYEVFIEKLKLWKPYINFSNIEF